MRNKKLSKSFADAMSAPLGSTDREYVKSTLSCMKKVSGLKNDAQGGPTLGGSFAPTLGTSSQPTLGTSSQPTISNYNNMLVFPAAPKFKTKVTPGAGTNNALSGSLPQNQYFIGPVKPTSPYGVDAPDYGIVGNALQPTAKLPINFAAGVTNLFNMKPTPKKVPEIDYEAEARKHPVNPGPLDVLKNIFSPDDLTDTANKLPYQYGIIPRAIGAVGRNVVPGTIRGLAAIGGTVLGGAQFATQNTIRGAADLWGTLIGRDPNTPDVFAPYIAPQDTFGAGILSDAISPLFKPSNSNLASTVQNAVNNTTPPVTPPVTPPAGTPPQGTPSSGIPPTGKSWLQQAYGTGASETKPIFFLGQAINATFSTVKTAMASQESGGSYSAVNPDSKALGKYQFMADLDKNGNSNLGYAGLHPTQQDVDNLKNEIYTGDVKKFLESPELQEKAYDAMTSDLYTKYDGDLPKILAAYYGGAGAAEVVGTEAGNKSQGKYPTVNQYVEQVMEKINLGLADSTNSGNLGYSSSNLTGAPGSGPYAYGSALARASLGGKTKIQVATDNYNEYLKSIEPLELELSNMKAGATNFVPTLTAYMQGKDQYSKALDSMIQTAKDSLLSVDMSDPASAREYNNNMNYLTTLKARQNGRYGNYLNSAVADYEADLTKMQNKVNNFKTNATNIMNQKNAIAVSTYDNAMALGAEAWTAMDNAPTKLYNQQLLQLQTIELNKKILGSINGSTTDPDYPKNLSEALKKISIDNGVNGIGTGTLDTTKIGADGLLGLYLQDEYAGIKTESTSEAIRTVLANTLQASSNDPKKVAEIRKMIEILRNSATRYDDEASVAKITRWADYLSIGLQTPISQALSGYIKENLTEIKSAAKDLVSEGGFFSSRKAGIQDKAGWMKDHSSLDSDFLENLYDTINKNVGQGTEYTADPMGYINKIFSGKTDQDNADNLASRMSLIKSTG